MEPKQVPILVLNLDKVIPPTDVKKLEALGFQLILTEGADVPAVQTVPSKQDRRFTAAVAAMQGWLAGRGAAPLSWEDRKVLAKSSAQCADALLDELDNPA